MKRLKKLLSILMVTMLLSFTITVSAAEVDPQAPIVSCIVNPNLNSSDWSIYPVQVFVGASSNYELAIIGYKLDDEEAVETEVSGTEVAIPLQVSKLGKHVLTYWATDISGRTSEIKIQNINIDYRSPKIKGIIIGTPNQNNWYNSDVTVKFEGTDDISGVYSISPDAVFSQDGLNYSATGKVTDYAGNSATTTVSGINIDKTPPVISGEATTQPNENGWYKDNVTVRYTASDNLSGIESCSSDDIISEEGINSSTGTAVDKAGNPAQATVSGIKIDKTAPTVELEGIVNGGQVYLNSSAKWTAADSLSGMATENSGTFRTDSVGPKSAVIIATDLAGNTTTMTVNYTVVYNFGGFLPPVKPESVNTIKQGSTLPLKFQLTDANGRYIDTAAAQLVLVNNSDNSAMKAVSTNNKKSDTNQFRYDYASNQYVFNLNTKALDKADYTVKIILDDASEYTFIISLR